MKPACHTIAGGYGTKDAAADLTGMKPTTPTKLRRETVERTDYTDTIVFEPAEEGGCVVSVPALPE